MVSQNPCNFKDQGVFHEGYDTSLDKILRSLPNPNLEERDPCVDDFWLVSRDCRGSLQICMITSERCALFYMTEDRWVWACDPDNSGDPILAWDPGAVELLIPARYMLLHRDAIPIITEFWETGEIGDVSGWAPYDHDELDYPVDNSCGHPECETKPAANKAE